MVQSRGLIALLYSYSTSFLSTLLTVCVILLCAGYSQANETIIFKGVKVKPFNDTYLVLKDVSVRSLPKTSSKRLGSLKSGDRVQIVGLAVDSWLAVRKKRRDFGFVYRKYLLPLIDGSLSKDLKGEATARAKPSTNCKFTISFEGKSFVEGQIFEISDYYIIWECMRAKEKIKFRTPMFITEAPYKLSQKKIFQITIDVLDLDRGYDEILSTFILFDKEKGFVSYDGVSIKKYGYVNAKKEISVKTIPQALKGAAVIAINSWNKKTWKELIKNMPNYPDPIIRKPESVKIR